MARQTARINENFLRYLSVGDKTFAYYSLDSLEAVVPGVQTAPRCIRLLLENILWSREIGPSVLEEVKALCSFYAPGKEKKTIPFRLTRVVASQHDAITTAVSFATAVEFNLPPLGLKIPLDIICEQPQPLFVPDSEPLRLLRWMERNVPETRVVPPGSGLVGGALLYGLLDGMRVFPGKEGGIPLVTSQLILGSPEAVSAAGAMGCLGVGGQSLDLEAALLDGSFRSPPPRVIGVKVLGKIRKDVHASDIGLALSAALVRKGTTKAIIEFFGPGLDQWSFSDRAVIADVLTARVGAMAAFFPLDVIALAHMGSTGRNADEMALLEAYLKAQKLWRESWPQDQLAPTFSDTLEFSLPGVTPFVGVRGKEIGFSAFSDAARFATLSASSPDKPTAPDSLRHGDIVWAEISACSTLHPKEMLAAALLARKAKTLGLYRKPWIRGRLGALKNHPLLSFLESLGLREPLEELGFSPREDILSERARHALAQGAPTLVSVMSGDHFPDPVVSGGGIAVRTSPISVVAFALAGTLGHNFETQPLGQASSGEPIFLKDILPTDTEIKEILKGDPFVPFLARQRAELFSSCSAWETINVPQGAPYPWRQDSPFIQPSPFVALSCEEDKKLHDLKNARLFLVLGDDVRTESLLPEGIIPQQSAAARYLAGFGVKPEQCGAFADYNGHAEVALRSAFPELGSSLSGDEPLGLFDLSARLKESGTAMIVVAGKNFGSGKKQGDVACFLRLLGVSIVMAESFDPSFRARLVLAGILPLQFKGGADVATLDLKEGDFVHVTGAGLIERLPSDLLVTFEQKQGVSRYMLPCSLIDLSEIALLKCGGVWGAALHNAGVSPQKK